MDDSIAIVTIIFGMPVSIVGIVSYFRYKVRLLDAKKGDPRELETLRKERKQLEARVQNLESIVCSVDLELNSRLNKLAAKELTAPGAQPQLPGQVSTAAPPPPVYTAGKRIAGRYTLQRELGRGGMGTVWQARDEQLGETVALKVVNTQYAEDPTAAGDRFRREASAARKITHANVIRIHDLVEDGQQILLSMEYVDGMSLATYLGRVGAMRIDEARHLLRQICDGLAAAHAAGVVHRDLKPANVLLDSEKHVKVIDFGIAKASFLAGMTATGLILGTPEYMAPEQVKGLPIDRRSDIYALGALAYHLLAGRPPFTGETPIAVGFAHVTESPRPLRELRPEVPPELEAAVMTALAKDPEKRFTDASELRKAL